MNQDMVFWGVIISLAGSIIVPVWLFYKAYTNAIKAADAKEKQ
ncbi:MAG: hypothetical protein PHY62_02945 [Gallionella sp.]|nr:hypothetical protein [Gallionella sp.]